VTGPHFFSGIDILFFVLSNSLSPVAEKHSRSLKHPIKAIQKLDKNLIMGFLSVFANTLTRFFGNTLIFFVGRCYCAKCDPWVHWRGTGQFLLGQMAEILSFIAANPDPLGHPEAAVATRGLQIENLRLLARPIATRAPAPSICTWYLH
jgi:hypothetical protein